MSHNPTKNKVFIRGNSTADFEFLRGTDNAVSFTLGTNETWRDKNSGETRERSEFHRCIAFGKRAEYLVKYGCRGSLVEVEGRQQTRKWQDKDNNDRYTTEIVCDVDVQILNGWKKDANQQGSQGAQQQHAPTPEDQGFAQPVPQSSSHPAMQFPDATSDDEVPQFQG